MNATSSNDVIFTIYQKNFNASENTLITLGTIQQTYNCVNYAVFLQEQISEQPTEVTTESTEPAETQPQTGLSGDVDENNKVDVLDVIYLNKVILGKDTVSGQGAVNADVDMDGQITALDALLIMKAIVELVIL